MDNFIKNFLNCTIFEKNLPNELPYIIHSKNIKYFKCLNVQNKMCIFDVLSLKIKTFDSKFIVQENNSIFRCFTKGSMILKINNKNPLDKFDKCNDFEVLLQQKICKKKYILKKVVLPVPFLNETNKLFTTIKKSTILYFKIYGFYDNQFKKINLYENFFEKVIIDLRDNMGGALSI